MIKKDLEIFVQSSRNGLVRLRTLIILRWLAVSGQIVAILIAKFGLNLQIDMSVCILVISASIIINLLATFFFPENQRLPERHFLLMLLFDLIQLGILLYLTGGLNNPFSILILAPVTVSAMTLRPFFTFFLSGLAIILVSILSLFYLPLTTNTGLIIQIPSLFIAGFWVSLMIGISFSTFYARSVTTETHSMGQALLATQIALGREQKLTDLGGVVAAAAHELGTPLATIALASSELIEELKNYPKLMQDAELIREQVERCKLILVSMGKSGKDDLFIKKIPINNLIEEATEPHSKREKTINLSYTSDINKSAKIPIIHRKPEIIHGLRNLIQNAVDFSVSQVWIDTHWNKNSVSIRISDDGEGYPPDLLGRIGDPFIKRRESSINLSRRPEYEGMGLGLFIAKTLLERSGATVSFSNGKNKHQKIHQKIGSKGAIADVKWARSKLENPKDELSEILGENQIFDI